MFYRLTMVALVLPGLVCLAPSAHAQDKGLTAEDVLDAIDAGVNYLKKEQRLNGGWPDHVGQPGGVTALCTLALLSAGIPKDDPCVQKALTHLRDLGDPKTVYTTSLQTMVFCAADPDADKLMIQRNAAWLEAIQFKDQGPNQGAWGYSRKGLQADRSNSQFALLALHEAERVGVEVSDRTWQLAHNYWLRTQQNGESWNYMEGTASTGSMTCAGIASLVITSGKLSEGDAKVRDGANVECCREQKNIPEIEQALAWLGRRFSVTRNPAGAGRGSEILENTWVLYYLYGLERVGRLTGRRFIERTVKRDGRQVIEKRDWYREGAEYLVLGPVQDKFQGYFKGRGHAEADLRISTAFALLFLGKGRRPVVMAKLMHATGDDWNRHRNDAANLTRYVERQWKRDLTWQVMQPTA
jgi:hypothetical protein